jgi:3-ketosteroid 9alpha-monooxygenase subunit B
MESPYRALRVARIVQETPDARSFVLDVPPELREAFAYRAGQFLTFRLPVGDRRLVRCYSLSSAPGVDAEWKVTVKRVAGGRASNWMHDAVREGDRLEVMRPAGRFLLSDRAAGLTLFAGGSGITPVVSLAKAALAAAGRRVRLLYANRDSASIIFRAELDALARRHADRLEVVHRLDVEQGFADAAAVRDFVGAELDDDFALCGPAPFMDVVERTLLALGVRPGRIAIERFEYAADGSPRDAVAVERAPGGAAPERLRIRLDGREHDVPYRLGDTVVEALRRAGVEPPTSCEEGYCGCCMAYLREGAGRMKANLVLDERQLGEGWVLTCQLVPTSPTLRIEYPE